MRRALGWAALVVGVAGLAAGYARGCTGPRPEVVGVRVEPLAGGMRAVATVRNRGGEGDVEVTFRLIDPRTGRLYVGDESSPLRRGERTEVSTWIAAPAGDYRVEAEAEYPPR